jgi:peroxin-10
MIALQVVAPYVLARVYGILRRSANEARERVAESRDVATSADHIVLSSGDPVSSSQQSLWTRILAEIQLPAFESLVEQHLRPVHLAAFYLTGRYYHIAKRVLSLGYACGNSISLLDLPSLTHPLGLDPSALVRFWLESTFL